MRKLYLVLASCLFCVIGAQADVFSTFTSRTSFPTSVSVDWGSFGSCNQTPSDTVTVGSFSVTAATSGGSFGVTRQTDYSGAGGCSWGGWFGNFAPGDNLLWTGGNGPLTIAFNNPIAGFGTQFQAEQYLEGPTPFDAVVSAYNGSNLIGTWTFSSISDFTADNSAVFFGVLDHSGSNITAIVLDTTAGGYFDHSFSVNALELYAVPEPTTLLLVATGLAGTFIKRRRR